MIFEGLQLMLIGMSVVFAFLFLLVVAMTLTARFFDRFGDLLSLEESDENGLMQKIGTHEPEIALVVAIAHAFEADRKKVESNG